MHKKLFAVRSHAASVVNHNLVSTAIRSATALCANEPTGASSGPRRENSMFGRVKSLDASLATAEKKSLHRSLGAFQLTMLGVGAVIGTGIFVLTAEAAQKAGPGMMLSFIIAGFVCAVAALCYAEMAAMVPVSGSAYTYSYAGIRLKRRSGITP